RAGLSSSPRLECGRGRLAASPLKQSAAVDSRSQAEPRPGYGAFRHRIIFIDSVPADPDRAEQTVGCGALIDRLAAGEGNDSPVSQADVVIAHRSGQRPKRIRIADAEQRGYAGVRTDIMRVLFAGAIGPREQSDRPAVQRLLVAAKRHRGEGFGNRDLDAPPP